MAKTSSSNKETTNRVMRAEWREKLRDIVEFVNENNIRQEDILTMDGNKEDGFILTYFIEE